MSDIPQHIQNVIEAYAEGAPDDYLIKNAAFFGYQLRDEEVAEFVKLIHHKDGEIFRLEKEIERLNGLIRKAWNHEPKNNYEWKDFLSLNNL
jgi:hypothetical protein